MWMSRIQIPNLEYKVLQFIFVLFDFFTKSSEKKKNLFFLNKTFKYLSNNLLSIYLHLLDIDNIIFAYIYFWAQDILEHLSLF